MLGSSQLIGRPLPLNAEGAPFFRPFGHHCQLLIWLAAGIIVQPLDLTRVALHGNIIETADCQAPARVRCCDKTSLCKKRATPPLVSEHWPGSGCNLRSLPFHLIKIHPRPSLFSSQSRLPRHRANSSSACPSSAPSAFRICLLSSLKGPIFRQ